MKKSYLFYILFALVACNDIEDCQLDPYVDFLGISFNYLDQDTELTNFTFQAVEVDGLGFFNNTDTITDSFVTSGSVFLPVDIENDSTTYRFYTDSIDYFVTIAYNRQGYLYELDCDAGIKFTDLTVTNSNLDSVSVVDVNLNKNTLNNIEIYF